MKSKVNCSEPERKPRLELFHSGNSTFEFSSSGVHYIGVGVTASPQMRPTTGVPLIPPKSASLIVNGHINRVNGRRENPLPLGHSIEKETWKVINRAPT